MTKVHKLIIEPMTEESFEPYGRIVDYKDHPADHRVISSLPFEVDGKGTLGVIWQPYLGLTFRRLERHFGVTQSFIQMSGSPAVVAVAEATDMDDPLATPDPEDVRAFLIDHTKGYMLNRGTWHSLNRFILAPPGATFAILNSEPNPTQIVNYEQSHTLMYKNLGSSETPTLINLTGRYNTVFEIGL